ncbi:MAG TPA: alginate lyase family protein [Thermoanaerobaculia bacterium]
MRLLLFYRTLQYLPAAQVRARLRLLVKRRWRRLFGTKFSPPKMEARAHQPLWTGLNFAPRDPARIARAQAIAENRFSFLEKDRKYEGEVDWHDATVPQLWRYHLHYFDYVLDLALAGEFATFKRLVQSWLRGNVQLVGDGWHPYTVSLRAVNWCHAMLAFQRELDQDSAFRTELVRAIAGHVRFVYNNLELDVRGNHLLENLRALIWGGIVFGEERWLKRGMELLETEVATQVLPDGCHFERAPGYHLIVLRDLLEIRLFLQRNRTSPAWLDEAVSRMLEFLKRITGPEDRLPLFKDTVLSRDFPPSELLALRTFYRALVQWNEPVPEPPKLIAPILPSGWVIARDPRAFIVADYGKPCPDELPAHAHADMFSYELTIDGKPCIVDSGVFEYSGLWRNKFRGTAAHNTVEVNDQNQSEVWGSFRVARRAKPKNVRWLALDGWYGVEGEHDGYERLRTPVTHRRTLLWRDGLLLVVDELLGDGSVRAKSRIHCHPENAQDVTKVTVFGTRAVKEEQGWYSERFGEKREAPVLLLEASGPMPLVFGYCVARGTAVAVTREPSGELTIEEPSGAIHTVTVPRP